MNGTYVLDFFKNVLTKKAMIANLPIINSAFVHLEQINQSASFVQSSRMAESEIGRMQNNKSSVHCVL